MEALGSERKYHLVNWSTFSLQKRWDSRAFGWACGKPIFIVLLVSLWMMELGSSSGVLFTMEKSLMITFWIYTVPQQMVKVVVNIGT